MRRVFKPSPVRPIAFAVLCGLIGVACLIERFPLLRG